MDVGRGRTRARAHRRRIAATGASAVVLLLASLLVPASSASASGGLRTMSDGGTLAVRSGDGCRLRPVRLTSTPLKTRRDYTCALKGPAPWFVFPPGGATHMLYNGDTLTVVASDGCRIKAGRFTTTPVMWRRDLTCTRRNGVAPPPPANAGQPPSGVTGGATWTTIWSDDFNGNAVNPANWNVANNSNFGSGNHEDQCYRQANVTVGGGVLQLTGRRQTVTGCGTNPDGNGSNYYFTSGMLTTRAQDGGLRMKYRYGYAEARMLVPRGNLYWPAFWLVGAGDGSSPGWPDYGEVDVTEIYGSHPDISESNFHRAGGNIGARNHNVNSPPSSATGRNVNPPNALVAGGTNTWHRYGLNWTANRLDWYIDGVLVRSYTAATAADRAALGYEHSIILNLAMGGDGPRSPDHGYTGAETATGYSNGNLAADLPGAMAVDYVRIWQP